MQDEKFRTLDADLVAEARPAGGDGPVPAEATAVRGRVTKISSGMALFDGALAGEPGMPVRLDVQGFAEPLRARLVGPAETGRGVFLQLPLDREHLGRMRAQLAALGARQARAA